METNVYLLILGCGAEPLEEMIPFTPDKKGFMMRF